MPRARLGLPFGDLRSRRPTEGKAYIRRQSAIQLLGSAPAPSLRKPLVPEKSKRKPSVPSRPGNRRFQS